MKKSCEREKSDFVVLRGKVPSIESDFVPSASIDSKVDKRKSSKSALPSASYNPVSSVTHNTVRCNHCAYNITSLKYIVSVPAHPVSE